MAASDDNSWRTQPFRQNIITKIDDIIKSSNVQPQKNAVEMENQMFQKAKTREEYLGFVARIILHLQQKKGVGGPNSMAMMGGNQPGQGNITDPINALQNLASQGTRNPMMGGMTGPGPQGVPNLGNAQNMQGNSQSMQVGPNMGGNPNMPGNAPMSGGPNIPSGGNMSGNPNMQNPNMPGAPNMAPNTASSLLQTLGQRPNAAMVGLQGMQNKLPPGMQMAPNQMGNQGGPGPMNSQNVGAMPGQLISQLQSGPMTNQMPSAAMMAGMGAQNPQMGPGPMGNPLQMPGQLSNQMLNQMHMQQQRNPNFPGPRSMPPNQYMAPSPGQPINSPAGMSGGPMSNQMIPSPVLAPSPGSQMGMIGGPRSIGVASSPGSSLPTPGPPNPNASPLGIQEDQAYRDKVRQLSKYLEPLRKMIGKCENGDEKIAKLKKLYELLSNPSGQRVPLETLLKCEAALEKMDFKRGDGPSVPSSSITQLVSMKEYHTFNPLLEALNNCLQSPAINHTLQRTFGPSMTALNGPDIKNLPPPMKRKKLDAPTSDIPDVLQGEIARLDSRFKVSLDPIQQPGSRVVHLTCWLDDRQLPCVPPVSLTIPDDYPKSPPNCSLAPQEYNATKFLCLVQKVLLNRISKLPKQYSMSQLLDTWEMSVRQACSPNQVPVTAFSISMGL